MYIYTTKKVATRNHKYADSSSNYYVIMMVQNMKQKLNNPKFPIFSHSRGTKCRVKANTNRDAVGVCGKQVKRPSKRSELVYTI